jgi:hypothetical protein
MTNGPLLRFQMLHNHSVEAPAVLMDAANETSRLSKSFALEIVAFVPEREHETFRKVRRRAQWVVGLVQQVHYTANNSHRTVEI